AKRKRKLQTPHTPPWWARWLFSYPRISPAKQRPVRRSLVGRLRKRCCQLIGFLLTAVGMLLVFTAIFGPSYTRSQYPESWRKLDESVRKGGGLNPPGYWMHLPGEGGRKKTTATGRGNPNNERIFIAANIVNAELIDKEWGERVMELVDLLGEENVFLSIFENDSGLETRKALGTLSNRIKAHMPKAGQSITSTTLPFSGVPRVKVPGGETYVKRITYLAEVRNRALLPLIGSIPSLTRWNQTSHPPTKTPPSLPSAHGKPFPPSHPPTSPLPPPCLPLGFPTHKT
ncbi:cryptococcal mannosyltransferase 1-domain-containing protein, partial [Trichophaea hybrida]